MRSWPRTARPEKGKNRAIAEVPTWTEEDGAGIADYVLFVGTAPYGVVEAKKKATKIPSTLEQSKRYARGLAASFAVDPQPSAARPAAPDSLAIDWGTSLEAVSTATASRAAEGAAAIGWATSRSTALVGTAPRYQVPFLYATNGRPYLRQLETESGVWFLDVRDPTNHPRALTGWHTPEVLVEMRAHDPAVAQAKLITEPADLVAEALGLRPYQVRAIRAVEAAIGAGQRRERDQERRRPVLHATAADRRDGRGDEAAAGRAGAELVVARDLRAQPVMHPPGLELRRRKDPLDRRCRDRADDAIADQRSRQFGAGPGRG